MDNIKDYENTVTERLYDLMANINPCESCKFRGGTTDKCGNCCFWYPSEFVMGDESEPEKPTSDKDTLTLEQKAEQYCYEKLGFDKDFIAQEINRKLRPTEPWHKEPIDHVVNESFEAYIAGAKEAAEIIKAILSRPDGQISYETRAKAQAFIKKAEE